MSKSSMRRFNMSLQILRSSAYCRRPANQKMEQSYDYNRKWMLAPNIEANPFPRIKLLSYNILAQDLLMEHLFLYVNIKPEWLTWQRRLNNLQREISKLNPDILCLQEMQYNHLPMLVQRLTASSGKRLEYVYKKKTDYRTDGCAIIYDASKFRLVCQQGVELYDSSVPLLNRGNVAILAKFQLKQKHCPQEEPKEVIIATTHLLYNPKRDDVRCAQVSKLLTELHSFAADQPPGTGQGSTPVILTGDFNSPIGSPPIELLTVKDANESALNLEPLDYGDCTASTFQENWITVDYILRSVCPLSKHQLQVLSIYRLPTIDCCAKVGNIPNHYLGSDHYALGAVFALA
ncbi:protein angel [Drosophila grimshawi]|uniref:protein angel n=1 Tax=Drosophila grimshawi TaxID=7222 RepID=UPI000C871577|nr:protein angel [Drosophila grimshawi]